jgi:hypothetical protein
VLKQVRFAGKEITALELPEAEVVESILVHHDILLLVQEDIAYESP